MRVNDPFKFILSFYFLDPLGLGPSLILVLYSIVWFIWKA